MFCPQCATNKSEEWKYCKSCGVTLDAVREVAAMRPAGEKFDWSRTWVAEMFLSESERKRRKEQIDRERGITPEMKRRTEIKAGVITSSVGVGLTIFLYVFMQGVILSGHPTPGDAAILSRLSFAAAIPFFVVVALIINCLLVSQRQVEVARRGAEARPDDLMSDGENPLLRSA